MKKIDTLRVMLADDDEDDRSFFKRAISEVRIKTKLVMVNNWQQLIEYLLENETSLYGQMNFGMLVMDASRRELDDFRNEILTAILTMLIGK